MAPRRKKTETNEVSKNTESSGNHLILILPDILTKDQNSDKQLIKLRHPQTGELAMFVYSENDGKLAQMRSFPCRHRTLLKKNELIRIRRVDFVTLTDPLFIFLPYFIKCSPMFSPLDQILIDEDFPALNNKLTKLSEFTDLQLVANKKESGDLILWQYSESKTLEWLSPKVEKLEKALVTQEINVNQNAAVSSNFKLGTSNGKSSEEEYKRYACSILFEYLPVVIQKALLKRLGLTEKVECTKRKADGNTSDVNKKVKHNIDHDEMPVKVEKVIVPKLTAKDKALKKAASGTKSISSFFKKK